MAILTFYREVRLALTKSLPADFYDLLIVIRLAAKSHLDAFHRSAFSIEVLIAKIDVYHKYAAASPSVYLHPILSHFMAACPRTQSSS